MVAFPEVQREERWWPAALRLGHQGHIPEVMGDPPQQAGADRSLSESVGLPQTYFFSDMGFRLILYKLKGLVTYQICGFGHCLSLLVFHPVLMRAVMGKGSLGNLGKMFPQQEGDRVFVS